MADVWGQWVAADAPKYGIDPRAANAISMGVEWPSRRGVGDQGTSYGPFQLHRGGALPAGRGRAWAESRAGVDYALKQMAQAGARGLRGPAAIAAISRGFERPADAPREIRLATQFYKQHGGVGAVDRPVAALAQHTIQNVNKSVPGGNNRKALLNYLLGNLQNYVQTGSAFNPNGLASLLTARPVAALPHPGGGTIPVVAEAGAHVGGQVGKNAQHIIQQAKHFLGTPYHWGGANPQTGFDCSGFVQWLYGRAGIKLGRTTYDQVKQGTPVGRKGLKAGDVIFFSNKGDVHHEALYLGGGKFIHAPHTGDVIKISSLSDPYYSKQFAGGRRFLGGK